MITHTNILVHAKLAYRANFKCIANLTATKHIANFCYLFFRNVIFKQANAKYLRTDMIYIYDMHTYTSMVSMYLLLFWRHTSDKKEEKEFAIFYWKWAIKLEVRFTNKFWHQNKQRLVVINKLRLHNAVIWYIQGVSQKKPNFNSTSYKCSVIYRKW